MLPATDRRTLQNPPITAGFFVLHRRRCPTGRVNKNRSPRSALAHGQFADAGASRTPAAHWIGRSAVCDPVLVTTRTPDDIPDFNARLIKEITRRIHSRRHA